MWNCTFSIYLNLFQMLHLKNLLRLHNVMPQVLRAYSSAGLPELSQVRYWNEHILTLSNNHKLRHWLKLDFYHRIFFGLLHFWPYETTQYRKFVIRGDVIFWQTFWSEIRKWIILKISRISNSNVTTSRALWVPQKFNKGFKSCLIIRFTHEQNSERSFQIL